MRRFKIKSRLMVSFLLLSIIPLGICGVFSYKQSRNAIDSKIRTYSTQIVRQVSNNINIEISKIKGIATDIIIDSNTIQNEIDELLNGNSYTKLQANQKIENFLSGKLTLNADISSIGIYFNDGSTIYSGLGGEVEENQVEQLEALIDESNRKGVWSTISKDDGKPDLAYICPIRSINSGETYGNIIITISNNLLANAYKNIDIGDGAVIFVLSADGQIVSVVDKYVYMADRSKSLIKKVLEHEKNNNSIFYDNSDGEASFISFSRIADTDWFVVASIPDSYLNAESNSIRNTIVIISGISIILAYFISSAIASSVSVPSQKLIRMMMEAKSGNLALKINDNSNDELGHITTHFYDMPA